MQSVTRLPVNEMAGRRFLCSCGREHAVDIQKIAVGPGVFPEIMGMVRERNAERVYLICDDHTWQVAGERAESLLKENGTAYHTKIFSGTRPLIPDEAAVGSILAEMEAGDDLILAVGSGTLNDLSKIISARTSVPYMIAATAPSMDGYASTVSPLILGGTKITKEAVYPAAVIADTGILKDAPMPMLTAGYGDIIGKLTANADWRLSKECNGEYYCETCADIVNQAVEKCAENGGQYRKRDEQAVQYVTEALILSGVAIGLLGNSRPASGAEHHFAHYWEVDALGKGEEHALHGNAVAVGAVVSAMLYELAAGVLPGGFTPPNKERIVTILRQAGAPVDPKEIGIGRELFHRSVLHAMEIRERYTILRFCAERDLLKGFADTLTERFYA